MEEHKHYVRVCTNIYIVLHSFKSFFYNLEEWNKMFHSVQMYQANINHLIYQSYDLAFYKIYTNKYLNHKQNIRVWIFSSIMAALIYICTNKYKQTCAYVVWNTSMMKLALAYYLHKCMQFHK